MSKKIINTKLENLFTNITNEELPSNEVDTLSEISLVVQSNWTWETDINGIVVDCSKEISDVLGFSRLDVIGQPFFSFGLAFSEQHKLREIINANEFPVEIELAYIARLGEKIRVRTNIHQNFDSQGDLIGYKCFSQQVITDENLTVPVRPDDMLATLAKEIEKKQVKSNPRNVYTRPLSEIDIPEKNIDHKSSNKSTKLVKPKTIKPRTQLSVSKPDQVLSGTTTQLPPIPLSTVEKGADIAIKPTMISGIAIKDNVYVPAEKVWTNEAQLSYQKDQLVSKTSENNTPAVISVPLKLRDQKTGVVEIVDSQHNRKWSEEDRLLVQEVTNQLALALENAQLYSAVQKELEERVKAERETLKRNEALAKLNLVMQQLTRLVSRSEIFEIVSSAIQDIFTSSNVMISLFDSINGSLSFPVCVADGESVQISARPLRTGYQETVLESKTSLLINGPTSDELKNQTFDHPNGLAQSLLAVPLLIGDRALGVISVFDFLHENSFDNIHVELLSTIAGQTATSIENANLFHEISQALETIEVRERYQSNVTKAVAALSENGSSTVDFLLESLANAAKCDRTSYVGINDNPKKDANWLVNSCYISQEKLSSSETLIGKSFSIPSLWIDQINQNGYFQTSIETATDLEKSFLDIVRSRSILLLGINAGDGIPTFLLFENITYPYAWKSEEINILSIAADAFRNTLLREGLLKQVQTSLDETENLYSASHRLALANSLSEMVSSIIEGINIPVINRGVLVLFGYDSKQEINKLTVEANYYSGVGNPPPPEGTEYLLSMYQSIFAIEDPVFYDDLLEAQIDEKLQKILISQNIRSMGILPLWTSNTQLGVLLIQTTQKHRFGPQEMRSFPPLVDQMATAIENQRLFKQTQDALAETGLLYEISSGISRSTNVSEYVKLIGMNAMPNNAESLWLLTAGPLVGGKPQYFEIIGSSNNQGVFTSHGGYAEYNLFEFMDFSKNEPAVITTTVKSTYSEATLSFLKSLDLKTSVVLPLQTAGVPVGLLITGSANIIELDSDEIHTLLIVGNSIAVAIERQRLMTETQRRALELQTAAEIARDTTSTLSLDILLSRIVNLLKQRFDYYHCSIFLVDEVSDFAVIQESTGDAGNEMKRRKHQLAVGSKSVIGTCTGTGEPVIVNDVKNSPIYYPNPLLPDTRSELGLPLKITGKVIGAIDLQSSRRDAFDENELKVLQILADQVAVAVENARAFEISQKAVEEMRELDRVKGQFLANMSHELRTPLNSVIGFSRVILKGIDGPINDTQEQDITAIYNSGMHLLNMINEILDLSKIEAGRMELQIDDVNISDIINSAITNTTGMVKEKPIDLIQKVPGNLPTIRGDEIRLSQVVINLISNAIKFTEKGTISVEASLQNNSQNKPEILVTVTDTGMGIAVEDQTKLFQRFSQVDDSPTRKTGGTGLGLSICRSLIELHGGKIGLLRSEVGKGSVFYFTLPAPENASPVDLDHLNRGENVILSIDDDPQVISLYDRFLRPQGYEVIPLTDPLQAVDRARELKPFAITLDIMMPQKDGWQVLHDLKKDDETKNIPIMICSILEEEQKGFDLGAADYLVKPFLQDDLAGAIHRLGNEGEIQDVMIVDDDPSDLRLLQKMIEDEGNYMAVLAESGASALRLLKDFTPDIILLDLFMPDMNGFDLMDHFKTDARLSKIPVIVLTGADLSTAQKKILTEFGDQILTKGSLHEKDLLNHLQATLNKIRPTRLVN